FSRRDRGIGYLTGEADDAQITRTHFVDGPGAEAVAARARAMREAEGRVTGYAGGQADATPVKPVFDLLKDLVAVFPAKEKTAWNSHLVDLLVELRPDFYGQRWNDLDEADKTSALTGALKEVKAEQIVVSVGRRIDGKSVTRRGVNRDTLQEIITLRDGKPGGG
ncbi:MAG: cell division protein FtsK, partial [Stackebrandtia sp.]